MAKCNLEIVSFNARGLGTERKRKKVIFLQETHSTKEVEKLWEYQWRKKIFYSHGTSNSRGVCIALRVGLDYKLLSPEVRDDHGRYLISCILRFRRYLMFSLITMHPMTSRVK